MFKFKRGRGLSAVPVVVILMLCGVVVSIFIFNTGKSTTAASLDGTYQAYETLTGEKIQDPYYPPGSTPGGVGNVGGGTPVIPEAPNVPDIPETVHSGIIPEGATYTMASGATLNPGDAFPDTVTTGDSYTYGDYEYRYNYSFSANSSSWEGSSSQKGWGVHVLNTSQTTYGEILSSIANKPVTSLRSTFGACTLLEESPYIPTTITTMESTFNSCYALKHAPKIPENVTTMATTFRNCTSLVKTPDMSSASSVRVLLATFEGCTSLKDASDFIVPSSVFNMNETFWGCTALETAPIIPSSVTSTYNTFRDCTALTGEVEINANPSVCDNCFKNTVEPITIIGSCSDSTKIKLAATANNGNVTY